MAMMTQKLSTHVGTKLVKMCSHRSFSHLLPRCHDYSSNIEKLLNV